MPFNVHSMFHLSILGNRADRKRGFTMKYKRKLEAFFFMGDLFDALK